MERSLVELLLYENYQNSFFIEIIGIFYEKVFVNFQILYKQLHKIKKEDLRLHLIILFKKGFIGANAPDNFGNVQLNLNWFRFEELMHKQIIFQFFRENKSDIEAIIVEYFIQNYLSKKNQVIKEIFNYLQLQMDSKQNLQLIQKAINKLIEENILLIQQNQDQNNIDNQKQNPILMLNIQKIYYLLRNQSIYQFFKYEAGQDIAQFIYFILNDSSLYGNSAIFKNTENFKFEDIKIKIMKKDPIFSLKHNLDIFSEKIQNELPNYFIIDQNSIQIKIETIIQQMKVYLVENYLKSKDKDFLRIFKGICVNQIQIQELSEKLLIKEGKLKHLLLQLERENLISKIVKENNQIYFQEQTEQFLHKYSQKLQKIYRNVLAIKKREKNQKQTEKEAFLLKETKLSQSLKNISQKLLILNNYQFLKITVNLQFLK